VRRLDAGQCERGGGANALQDLMGRGGLEREGALRLAAGAAVAAGVGAVAGRTDLPPFDDIARAFPDRVRQLGTAGYPPPLDEDEPLDYVALVDDEHDKRRRAGRRKLR